MFNWILKKFLLLYNMAKYVSFAIWFVLVFCRISSVIFVIFSSYRTLSIKYLKFYVVQLSEARLSSETRSGEERELRSVGHHPTYFQWEKGRVVRVFLSDDDSTFTSNIKKGIIDMFQLRVNDAQHNEVTWYFIFISTKTIFHIFYFTLIYNLALVLLVYTDFKIVSVTSVLFFNKRFFSFFKLTKHALLLLCSNNDICFLGKLCRYFVIIVCCYCLTNVVIFVIFSWQKRKVETNSPSNSNYNCCCCCCRRRRRCRRCWHWWMKLINRWISQVSVTWPISGWTKHTWGRWKLRVEVSSLQAGFNKSIRWLLHLYLLTSLISISRYTCKPITAYIDNTQGRNSPEGLGVATPHYEVGFLMYCNPQNLRKFKKFDSIEGLHLMLLHSLSK